MYCEYLLRIIYRTLLNSDEFNNISCCKTLLKFIGLQQAFKCFFIVFFTHINRFITVEWVSLYTIYFAIGRLVITMKANIGDYVESCETKEKKSFSQKIVLYKRKTTNHTFPELCYVFVAIVKLVEFSFNIISLAS